MKILLLVSAIDEPAQRIWCALREAGHEVSELIADLPAAELAARVHAVRPQLILCPFLSDVLPPQIWRCYRTIVIHPGPVGDRGPSALDWAISDAVRTWGVTARQAVDVPGTGPVWAERTFALPAAAPRRSALYRGAVSDAAMQCVDEVLGKARDPSFVPVPQIEAYPQVPNARPRPLMAQADRAFDWADDTASILRKIRAADGFPGVRVELAGRVVDVFDAHPGPSVAGPIGSAGGPGALLRRREGAVLVGTGDSAIWLGHLRPVQDGEPRIKLPATHVLGAALRDVPNAPSVIGGFDELGHQQIRYRRDADVGMLSWDFYNGAMSTGQCRRLLGALRHAIAQPTRVLVLTGSTEAFSRGINLNVIEAAADPATAAWANVRALNELCHAVVTCTRQVVITAYTGTADGGGLMLGLGADLVVARDGVVLNPSYAVGLVGSELHTYLLPRRVGAYAADRLLTDRPPLSPTQANKLGLLDEIGPRDPDVFADWLGGLARQAADRARPLLAEKRRRLQHEPLPLQVYEIRELAELSRDVYEDRHGFTAARHAYVHRRRRRLAC